MARRFLPALVLLVAALLVPFLRGQDVASITGVITDQTGAVIPGVRVTLQNLQTGAVYTSLTNDEGSYTLNQVKPGPNYRIEFSRDGFNSVVIGGLYLNVDSTRTQNAQLSIGTTHATVEVSAAGEDVTLDTTDATVGNNFQVQFLNDLPVEDRNSPSALFVQQPGVTLDGAVTGARVDQDRVTLDGLDVNDMATGEFGAIVGGAPVDSVQEFRGVGAGFLPSAPGGGGGQFELVTRSGSNNFHGALVEYHRDTDLEANDWFNNNTGVPRPPLVRNQFGGNVGGPIIKDKLFFFFDYNGRRDTLSRLEEQTVPIDSFRNGSVSYLNSAGTIETLSPAQVAALDPLGVGLSPALQSLFSSRYPHANDLSGGIGDLINTAGFRFNAPFPYKLDEFVQRVDYNLNSNMKLFGRGSFTRLNSVQGAIQFPGDPETYPKLDHSYAWVVGHTWAIKQNMVNQASYGEVFEDLAFPDTYNPTGITQYTSFGNIASPYGNAYNSQSRTYPIPVIRDDFSWQKGRHGLTFGGTFKYISPTENSIFNYNSPTVGLGGNTLGLIPSLRPSDIGSGNAIALYDSAFALALAPFTAVSSNFNYNAQGNVLPQGSGALHHYRYYETELYFGDTWKVRPALTLSYGLRWSYYTVPYERNGIESVVNYDFDTYLADRVAQSEAAQSGNLAVPLISYSLGGKANHAPGYYSPDHKDFGPRFAFAYSPERFHSKTVFNGGAGIIFDQTIVNTLQQQQAQFSYLFESSVTEPFGTVGDPVGSLTSDTRFSGLNNPPPAPIAPTITKPFFPFVSGTGSSAVPFGLQNGLAFNEIIDPKLKTPYSIQYSFGLQHEFPHGYLLKTTYVGRLGRRLLAQADAEQLIDFPDVASGQLMSTAFANITQYLRAGGDPANAPPQPWYEDLLPAGLNTYFGLPNNTSVVTGLLTTLVQRGDFADTTQQLSGVLPPNVGMAAQFSENTFFTNKGFSSYNGLLTTLHKNLGYGLQFDINYTFSHSIDNVSLIANMEAFNGYGFICDVLRPRECRANSDFDVTQYLNGNFIYDLPFGRGKSFASASPRWLDEMIGGWKISGLPSWHSGNVYFASSNAFVAGYSNDAPAILTGPISDLKLHLHGGHGQPLYGYTNPTQANADYTGPVGFTIGSRNNLRGPGYFDLDMGVGKSFPVYAERVRLQFRVDAFNAFNHPNFYVPTADITDSSTPFGIINKTVGTGIGNAADSSRVLQASLRLEF